jgi:hypothetical protein
MSNEPIRPAALPLRGWDNGALRERLRGTVIEPRSIESELRLAMAERGPDPSATSSGRRSRRA